MKGDLHVILPALFIVNGPLSEPLRSGWCCCCWGTRIAGGAAIRGATLTNGAYKATTARGVSPFYLIGEGVKAGAAALTLHNAGE